MKNDLTTTVLNFVLAVLVLCSVFFALKTIQLEPKVVPAYDAANQARGKLMKIQALLNDAAVYNNAARNPELARILLAVEQKPAAH